MLNRATYLKYLQSILLEYDPSGAPGDPMIFCYFCKDLKRLIRVKLEYRDLELESFE